MADVHTPIGDAPLLPVVMILAGGYLAWFGVHYWTSDVKWPSDPVKSVLTGQGLPAANPEPSVHSQIVADTSALQADPDKSGGSTSTSSGNVPVSPPGATATFKQVRDWWTGAGGPAAVAPIAAAIAAAESGLQVTVVQQGQPYATTGWGLWQITPGNSVPSAGIDKALLTGPANADAAVSKYRGSGSSFRPWTTYTSGAYAKYLQAASG